MLSKSQMDVLSKLEDDYSQIDSDDELWEILNRIDSPIQLHFLPTLLNWDSGWTNKIMYWILDHPLCDAGTALSIYWLCDPQFYYKRESGGKIDDWARETYTLLKKCEALYQKGGYSRGQISFNPRDGAYLPADSSRDSIVDRLIPDQLKIATPGHEIPEYWTLKK